MAASPSPTDRGSDAHAHVAVEASVDPAVPNVYQSAGNHPQHAHALEASPWARSSSRLLLLVGGLVYASWHWVHKALQPSAVDPLSERLAFLALTVALVAASYHRALKRHLVTMGYVVVAVGTTHYFSLVARNNISSSYTIGVFVVLGAVSALLVSARAALGYAALTIALALTTTAVAWDAPLDHRLELVVGAVTMQIGLCVSAWRNSILKAATEDLEKARRQLRQLRGLLPICMHCNRIRDRGDNWVQFETYVEKHTEAAFSHGLCRECADKHYPGI